MASIVVGFDGSEQARRALERAATLAAGGDITVVTAVPFSPIATKGPSPIVDPREEEERVQLLGEAQASLAQHGLQAHAVEVHGDAATAIVNTAKDANADMIVIGKHGRHGALARLLGSTAEHVVRNAPCDVLVVK
jgi:nucleotide-binding universal stress UspA family protein